MPPGIEINLGFRAQDGNLGPLSCMAPNIVPDFDGFREGILTIGLAAGRNRIQIKQEIAFLRQRVGACSQKDQDGDRSPKPAPPEPVPRGTHRQSVEEGYRWQHENEIVRAEEEPGAYRDERE